MQSFERLHPWLWYWNIAGAQFRNQTWGIWHHQSLWWSKSLAYWFSDPWFSQWRRGWQKRCQLSSYLSWRPASDQSLNHLPKEGQTNSSTLALRSPGFVVEVSHVTCLGRPPVWWAMVEHNRGNDIKSILTIPEGLPCPKIGGLNG